MDMATLANPFRVWSQLARGLRDRFLVELGAPHKPYPEPTGEVLTLMAAIITRCEQTGTALHKLQQMEPEAFEAFLKALEKS